MTSRGVVAGVATRARRGVLAMAARVLTVLLLGSVGAGAAQAQTTSSGEPTGRPEQTMTPSAASSAQEVRLLAPGPGSRVTGRVAVVVAPEPAEGRTVTAVEVRLTRGGERVGGVGQAKPEKGGGGEDRWTIDLDPLSAWGGEGAVLPNDRYRLEARVITSASGKEEAGAWVGHEIVIDADPPTPDLQATAEEDSVALAWTPARLPDFGGYLIERAPSGGSFERVATLSDASVGRFRDAEVTPGSWRYRLVIVRWAAGGGERRSASPERSVEVAAPEPDPARQDSGGDSSQGDDWDGFSEPAVDPEVPTEDPSSAPAVPPVPRSGIRGNRPVGPPVGFSGDVYEDTLPYDPDSLEEQVVTERTVAGEGTETATSTLTISESQLDLEAVLTPIAGALLLFVTAGHVLAFRRR